MGMVLWNDDCRVGSGSYDSCPVKELVIKDIEGTGFVNLETLSVLMFL